jgi:flagellar biosynthesis/type III secretory pathway chaperone
MCSASRKEGLIAKMQTNENTYLKEPEESKVLSTFNSSFNIEEYTDEIAQLLNDYPDLRDIMDKLGNKITLFLYIKYTYIIYSTYTSKL